MNIETIFKILENVILNKKRVESILMFDDVSDSFFVVRIYRSRSPPFQSFLFEKLIGGKRMAKLPIRNKSKDNPYTLGYDEKKNVYTVEFVDNLKVIHNVEISIEVYNAFDMFELEDVSQIHKYQRHIEHSEVYEDTLNSRIIERKLGIEEIVEKRILNEELKQAIQELPETQRNRLRKYYFDNKTYEEIAREEKCTKRAVKFSVDIAIDKISKKLKK